MKQPTISVVLRLKNRKAIKKHWKIIDNLLKQGISVTVRKG